MAARKKQETTHLSILDAVEALETIADLEFEREVELASDDEVNEQNKQVTLRAVKWIGKEDPDDTAKLIKDTFHVVLDYLRDFYRHESNYTGQPKIVEGVKTIMVLVGEAAQKLDRYTTIFKQTKNKKVKSLQEYKQLQEFYLTRVARKIDEGILGKWILGLTKDAMARKEARTKLKAKKPPISTKHVFMDLEAVKKDTEYELFFLRKEDGTRFFNPRLIRNIKLVCDFGESIRKEKEIDPLEDVKVWHDHAMHIVAKDVVRSLGGFIDRYLQEARRSNRRELVANLNKALMALMMCANSRNLMRNAPVKTCSEYFTDFHFFLRRALHTREYQRMMVYRPKKSARLALCMMDMAHSLCGAIFSGVQGYKELAPVFERLIEEAQNGQSPEHLKAAKSSKELWNKLASDNSALNKLVKGHANGPLEKVLYLLEYGSYHTFDPIGQMNIPYQQYSLYVDENKMTNIRIPTPTRQEFIHKAEVVEEFKAFLRSYSRGQLRRKHLLFNLQDRTSWKEHIRCIALEDLQMTRQFSNALTVVTLAKDTEFYHQTAPYHEDHQADMFIQHFKENLEDENCGFFFPKTIRKKLFSGFVDKLIGAVHRVFFGEMNVLTVNNRRDFIEIFYFFLQLKVMELEKPDSFSFTCKDGIDAGGSASAQLFALLKVIEGKDHSKDDNNHLNFILYIAPLLLRERTILSDPFNRMISALKRVEATRTEMGEKEFHKEVKQEFGKLFDSPIFQSLTLVPTL